MKNFVFFIRFISYFRVSKAVFSYLVAEISPKLRPSSKSTAISPTLKLTATLRFLSDGSYQQGTGNDFNLGLAHPTVSKILKEVLNVMENHICPQWIKFQMSEEEKFEAKLHFFEKTGFPGVIGCVDGTHIKILTPGKEIQHLYYNRKGFYSLNAMVVNIICNLLKNLYYNNMVLGMRSSNVFQIRQCETSRSMS